MPALDNSRIREMNTLTVFRHLRRRSPATAASLVRDTGLTRPSVASALSELVGQGWVEALDPEQTRRGGRPANRFRYRAESGLVLGLDIGVHRVVGTLTDLAGHRLGSIERAVAPASEPSERLETMDRLITDLLGETGMDSTGVWSVVAAVTGPVDQDGRTSLFSPLPGWTEVDLAGHLRGRFDCPVHVDNDVKLALLAEQAWGAIPDASDVVYVLAGLRTGAAIMVGGQVLRGYSGAAGEIGALPSVRWHSAVGRLLDAPWLPSHLTDGERAHQVFARARTGDERALRAVDEYARDLATGAAALCLTIDPEVLVVGGSMVQGADLWLAELTASLNTLVLRTPRVETSRLDSQSVALGAVRRAMIDVESTYFGQRLRPAHRLTSELITDGTSN